MYRRSPLVILVISGYLFLSACVEKTEYDALQKKLDDTTKQLGDTTKQLSETKDSLKKAQDELTDLQAHRYQTFVSGHRTWRLDSAKGTSCVLLTSDEDWKNIETKKQSCACEDFFRDNEPPDPTNLDNKLYDEQLETFERRTKRLGCA